MSVPTPTPHILVIEDEPIVRANILALLRAEGFQAIGAENGQVGVQLAQSHLPDLIICDVMMPEMDGFDVLQVLRQTVTTKMIPFIFLSARSERQDFRQGMELGADDYLTKPFTRAELLQAITTRLNRQADIVQLQQKIDELQQANFLKDEFVNTAAHELRSPLANIKLAIQMLELAKDTEKQQVYLKLLHNACDREVELLNDLLDLQRAEAHSNEQSLEKLDLQRWIPAFTEPFYGRAQQRQQQLSIILDAPIAPLLIAVRSFERILTELLNNACKYTAPGGGIILEITSNKSRLPALNANNYSLTPELPRSSTNTLTIIVRNQAEIPAHSLPRIFDRFYRIPGGDRWNQGGTGLGLALVKTLVEQLGGNIQVTSASGWTQFTVILASSDFYCKD
ncbi:hybrid sensor histidine kinase/response regulator [Pantanalinema sp. GBBB05]|uniref:hybrid sensor histidine kinase/response regulator n=1 Tax=Pantanalinema sp. GBBB05 TaxID=2604139 RepID=UPI001D5C704C|nr:hybrid sensor histidine kinase/response regulator [Pantanalinema sp. GBBB05]